MTKEYVTKDDLRQITPGKTAIYALPSLQQCLSAQAMCSQLKRTKEGTFKTTIDDENKVISITRIS